MARKIKRPRAELVAEFRAAMQLRICGDIASDHKEHRVKALETLAAFQKAIPILPGETPTEELERRLLAASRTLDSRFFDEYSEAVEHAKSRNDLSKLLDFVFVVVDVLIWKHESAGTLPTKREIREEAQRMFARWNLVPKDREWAFRNSSPDRQNELVTELCKLAPVSERQWSRIFKDAHLTDFPQDPGGNPAHGRLF